MEKLCAEVLPKVWEQILALEGGPLDTALIRLESRLATLKEVSSIAWEFGATYFDDSPMHRFAMKLQAIVNAAEAGLPPDHAQDREQTNG